MTMTKDKTTMGEKDLVSNFNKIIGQQYFTKALKVDTRKTLLASSRRCER